MKTIFAAALTFLSLLLAGCSGLDDLQVTNRYPFAIELRKGSARGEKLAMLAPGETGAWDNEGGYKGGATETVCCTDPRGKTLGLQGEIGYNIHRAGNCSINGSGALIVTVGPR